MPAFIKILASYVPHLIIRQGVTQATTLNAPGLESFPAAVLFTDISGFTALSEHLAQKGVAGVEQLTQHLNRYFGQLIAFINNHGGDIIKFAGDALLALWPATEEDLATVTRRAAQCSLTIVHELGAYVADDVHLSLHIGLAAGETMGLRVGGVRGRWEFLIAGEPLTQIASAEANASAGEVCISGAAWELIQNHFAGTILESGNVRLEGMRSQLSPQAAKIPTLQPEMVAALRGYIPLGILERLDAGQTQWLAEHRCITVLFVQLSGLEFAPTHLLEQLQQAMIAMQAAVYRYEGTIRQLIVDDKGSVLIAAFGLPPFAHEDDALRGLLAALAIRDQLGQLGLASSIGVTTGWVYCGSVGSKERCEYAMVGDIVNLAARLMVAANHEILCDQTTYDAVQGHLQCETHAPIQVKGKRDPIAIYRPVSQAPMVCRLRMPMVGRIQERKILAERLERLHQDRIGGVVAIAGEAGIGKSRLVENLRDRALQLGVSTLQGAGNGIEKLTPYHAWSGVFSQLLQLERLVDPEQARFPGLLGTSTEFTTLLQAQAMAHLKFNPEWLSLAPLLNVLLPLNLPENDLTSQLSGEVRANNTNHLLVELLQAAANLAPKLVILEDAHWMDSASWGLVRAIALRQMPVLLVIVTRPFGEKPPQDYQWLLELPDTVDLEIKALRDEEALALVCQCLGVSRLPPAVATLVQKKAQGNPFFSEELVYALRDAGLIAIAEGECRLTTNDEDFQALVVPDHIQGIITNRLDRLTPMQQLTLKVASVIGRVFTFRVLCDIHPIDADKQYLSYYLSTLERLDLTPLETPEPNLAYIFKHIITQEVAYNLMLFAQRRELHYAVAQWYERNQRGNLSAFYPILAHHWSNVLEPGQDWSVSVAKAVDYLEKAGEQALRSYSLQETIGFFRHAIALVADSQPSKTPKKQGLPPFPDPLRQARWHRQLATAHLGLGQLPESRAHLEQAVQLLGRPVPRQGLPLTGHLLGQVVRQIWHRLGYIHVRTNSAIETQILLETARVYDLLAEIYYHANEINATLFAALRALNVAERAGSSPELARAYANSCFVAAIIPLRNLAEAYRHRSRVVTAEVNRPLEAEARVLVVTSLYSISVGQWKRVRKDLQKGVKICDRFGDHHQWGNCLAILAKAAYFQGDFPRGMELWRKLYQVAESREDILQQAWGLNGEAEGLVRQGEFDRATDLLTASLVLFAQNKDLVSETGTYGMLAIARLYRQEITLAREAVAETQKRLAQISSPNSYYLIEGYAGVAEVYLSLWEMSSDRTSAESLELAKLSRQACQALLNFARIFPIGQPRAWLWHGYYYQLAGRPKRAITCWQKSLKVAQNLGMRYEEGLGFYWIGQHSQESDRQYCLSCACDRFRELGAVYDLRRAELALQGGTEGK